MGPNEEATSASAEANRYAAPEPRSRLRAYLSKNRFPAGRSVLLLALVVATMVYVWPRTLGIDRVATVDEPVFLGISANFSNAIAHGDLAKTSQFLYPAVTIMWAGMLGFMAEIPHYVTDHPHQIEALKSVHEPIRAIGGEPLSVLVSARVAKIVLQAMVFLIALWLMYRLFGLAITALAAAFIMFDPFLIAHDQLLHVDGVTGITAFVSMLAAAYADREQTRKRCGCSPVSWQRSAGSPGSLAWGCCRSSCS